VAITYTSREQIDVYRFPLPVAVGIPLVAIFLQSFLPVHFHFFYLFDLPLLVTIFFALARRNPVSGLLTGGVIGMLQDSLTHQPIGIYGIAKTVIGYGASSLGVKLDVENSGSRFLVTFGFYLLHDLVYFAVARGLVGQTSIWHWEHVASAAFTNAVLCIPLFALLDRFKRRT
jgi:rod shape-determining protein MreD